MTSNNYAKGYSALRKIINDDELEFSRQFAKFTFCMQERWSARGELKGIYNSKTDNVIAFVNKKGNVFFRPNSIYADHILESKNHVIFHNDLRSLRHKVPSNIKTYAKWHNMAELAVDRLIENDDKPNKVFIFSFKPDIRIDERHILREMRAILKESPYKNTLYALGNSNLMIEESPLHDKYKVYLGIEDFSEAIAEKERVDRIKKEIAETFIGHIREVSQQSITNGTSMNPMQFVFTESNGTEVTGRIALNRLDMMYPSDMEVRDWLQPDYIIGHITFQERMGSLEERGIDEQAIREEHERRREERERLAMAEAMMYEEMARVHPGSINIMPRMSYSQYARGRVETSDWGGNDINPFGTGVIAHHVIGVDEAADVPVMEPGSVWTTSNEIRPIEMPQMPSMSIYEDEYPDTADEAEDILRELLQDTNTTTETESPMSSA